MDLIQNQDLMGFNQYLSNEQNTICGRHPICVFLEILRNSRTSCKGQFVHYSQSQKMATRPRRDDSCVSYAAGVCMAC